MYQPVDHTIDPACLLVFHETNPSLPGRAGPMDGADRAKGKQTSVEVRDARPFYYQTLLPAIPAENLLAFGGFGVENAKEKRLKHAFQIVAPAGALAESIEHKVGIATKPAFLLQEMQKDDASHQFLHIIVIDGSRLSLSRQLGHDMVVMDMVLVEELIAERIDRKGFAQIVQDELPSFDINGVESLQGRLILALLVA